MFDNTTALREAKTDTKTADRGSRGSRNPNYDLLVFCHLRWDFVYQRPQHIISRLAQEYRILFVEEPIAQTDQSHSLEVLGPNLHIFRPNISSLEELPAAIATLGVGSQFPLAWFYSASFSGVLKEIHFDHVIYDCMDELSLFRGAPAALLDQERFLLQHSDIVFTGGRSLFESKRPLHPNVHCFPSSVDFDHFAKAKNGIPLPLDIMDIPKPIVGYFGVIDERLDLGLVEKTALRLPQFSFVFIGPLAKIHDSELPRLPNIHYLGMKPYQTLPNYLKAFTIAMMPFALNDATKFISPTKTLEYMAAGKPIVSTRIKDVERDYSRCVHLVADDEDFADLLIKLLLQTGVSAESARYEEILKNTSWNATVNKMRQVIAEVRER